MKARRIRLLALGLAATALASSVPMTAFADEQDYAVESTADYDYSYDMEESGIDYSDNYEDQAYVEEGSYEQAYDETAAVDPAEEVMETEADEGASTAEADETEAADETAADETETEASDESADEDATDEEMQEADEKAAEVKDEENAEEKKDTADKDLLRADDEDDVVLGAAAPTKEETMSKDVKDGIAVGHASLGVVRDYVKDTVGDFCKAVPGGAILSGPFKAVITALFNAIDGTLPAEKNNEPTMLDLQNQLKNIENQIRQSEASNKQHTSDTVVINAYGTEFNTLMTKTDALNLKISSIRSNEKLSADEKSKKIAALMDDSYGKDLLNQLITTTRIFLGDTGNEAKARTLHDAVFSEESSKIMFSGEAMDNTAPYLRKRLIDYISAQTTLAEVLNEVEKTYGKGEANVYRQKLMDDLCGSFDKNGKKVKNGVLDKYVDYFTQSRTVFINKNAGTSKELDEKLSTIDNSKFSRFVKKWHPRYDSRGNLEGYNAENTFTHEGNDLIQSSGLTADEIHALQKYVNAKGITMLDYLKSVGFDVSNLKDKTTILSTLRTGKSSEDHGFLNMDTFYKMYNTGYRIDVKNPGEVHLNHCVIDSQKYVFGNRIEVHEKTNDIDKGNVAFFRILYPSVKAARKLLAKEKALEEKREMELENKRKYSRSKYFKNTKQSLKKTFGDLDTYNKVANK